MKGKETIIQFLVVIALLAYIVCSFLVIREAWELMNKPEEPINAALMNFSTALTGLVGGIVATAFGIKAKVEADENKKEAKSDKEESGTKSVENYSKTQFALQRLGGFAIKTFDNKRKEFLGNLFAWSYVIIGVIATGLWVYFEINEKNVTQNIATVGSTFAGMVVAIVSAYFRPTS